MVFYEIRQVNLIESIYQTHYLGENYDFALKKLVDIATWKAGDADILLLSVYGHTDYPSPYALVHFEHGQFFLHIWTGKKTQIEEFNPTF